MINDVNRRFLCTCTRNKGLNKKATVVLDGLLPCTLIRRHYLFGGAFKCPALKFEPVKKTIGESHQGQRLLTPCGA